MVDLEQRGRLDRRVEGLPTNTALLERKAAGKGLTRPELAVLLALWQTGLVRRDRRQPGAGRSLASKPPCRRLFPQAALDKYAEAMGKHRLEARGSSPRWSATRWSTCAARPSLAA
ncbi:hypothetical protein ACRAWD_25800 [Caulobacter segnis]